MGLWGLISPVREWANLFSFLVGGGIGQHNVTKGTHADIFVMSKL